jgi:hypothetical protein
MYPIPLVPPVTRAVMPCSDHLCCLLLELSPILLYVHPKIQQTQLSKTLDEFKGSNVLSLSHADNKQIQDNKK